MQGTKNFKSWREVTERLHRKLCNIFHKQFQQTAAVCSSMQTNYFIASSGITAAVTAVQAEAEIMKKICKPPRWSCDKLFPLMFLFEVLLPILSSQYAKAQREL